MAKTKAHPAIGNLSGNIADMEFANDPSQYQGQAGEQILIEAVDDMKIAGLTVAIRNLAGAIIEEGSAKLLDPDKPKWTYTTTTNIAAGEIGVTIEVTAVDMPGNKVVKQADRLLRRAA